jgi:hypothetical protein
MQRNQWPLRYKASEVRAAAARQELKCRKEAESLRFNLEPEEPDDSFTVRRSTPHQQARAVDKRAEEYGKWAKALLTRGEDVLALHFDDAEYFGLLVEEALELAKTGERPPLDLRRSRVSPLAVSN